MKQNKKKTLGFLSAMTVALACAGVATVPATAEGTGEVTGTISMHTGASVSLGTGYGGIRWKTYIDSEMWNAYGDGATYGTLIYPATATDVTLENAQEKGARIVWADAANFATENGSKVFYSAVSYDNIVEDYKTANNITDDSKDAQIQAAAYKLELKAVSFVKTPDEEVEYATETDTVRSARQVAIAADLKNDTDKITDADDKATVDARIAAYELGTLYEVESSTGTVYNLDETYTDEQFAVLANYAGSSVAQEILVGAKRIENANVVGNVVYLPEDLNVAAGETFISVIDEDGNIYSDELIVASKVLKTADDLRMFGAGTYSSSEGWDMPVQSGYYVLGNDIDAKTLDLNENYFTPSVDIASGTYYPNIKDIAGMVGLTGTFNGMGHTINYLNMRQYGLFGIINGGTVKNVAFANVQTDLKTLSYNPDATTKYSTESGANYCALARYAYQATLENIYIEAVKAPTTAKENSLFIHDIAESTMSNCVLKYDATIAAHTVKGTGMGSMLTLTNATTSTFNDVYVISKTPLTYRLNNAGTTATLVDGENSPFDGNTNKFGTATAANTKKLTGVKRYETYADMKSANNSYTSFDATYWTIENGLPVWNAETEATVEATELDVVVDMFSADDGVLNVELEELFGATAGQTVTLTKAYQDTTKLTVDTTDGVKVFGVTPSFIKENGYMTGVNVVPVTLVATVGEETKAVKIGLKAYTRVIDDASDLTEIFVDPALNNANTNVDERWSQATAFDGYYILGNNIEAAGVVKPAMNPEGSYMGMGSNQVAMQGEKMGLTGTFDGNGFAIKDIELSGGCGLFGYVNGGLVKNLAITGVKFGYVSNTGILAAYMNEALVENVYVELAQYSTRKNVDGVLFVDSVGSTYHNVLVVAPEYTRTSTTSYGSLSAWCNEKANGYVANTYSNVYVISKTILCNRVDKSYTVDAENQTGAKYTLTGVKRFETASEAGTVSLGYWTISNGTITWAKPNN